MACRCQGQCHGGVVQVDLFPFKDPNWKLVDTDNKHEGWIKSWRDMAGLPDHMVDFLNHLLVWPSYPVLWLDKDANRTKAPLFIAAHKGIAAQACWVQFGCRYCKHQTEFLYYAADDMYRKHATKVMITFFKPLLQEYLSVRGLSHRFPTVLPLTAANLQIIESQPAGRSRPSLPPPPTTPKRLTDSEAPSSGRGRPMTIIAIHGGTYVLQATTSLKPREEGMLGKGSRRGQPITSQSRATQISRVRLGE